MKVNDTNEGKQLEAAVKVLSALLGHNSSEITTSEIFRTNNRLVAYTPRQNEKWLGKKLTPVYHFKLVKPMHAVEGGKQKRVGIRLTQAGKEALASLRRAETTSVHHSTPIAPLSLTKWHREERGVSLMRLLNDWEKANPGLKITAIEVNQRIDLNGGSHINGAL